MPGAAGKAREALIAFLERGVLKPPGAVAEAPDKAAAGVGFLTPGFEEGALFLKDAKGECHRLEWPDAQGAPSAGADPQAAPDRRRALPPGEYVLTGYRIVRRDAKAVAWFLSATGPDLRRLVVRAGEEQAVRLDETLRLVGCAKPGKEGVEIQVKVVGEKGSGLSLYRDGRRVGIGYRIEDARKKELARGTLEYG